MSDSQYQARYWSVFVDVRVQVSYLHYYAAHSEWWDKAVNVFLAITSSGSIAAWALWREFTFVWPTLIAASQVIAAIKPFLPYKQRLKVISDLGNHLQVICLAIEKDWYAVAEGHLTEEEIHNLTIKYRAQALDAEQKHLKDIVVPRKPKLLAQAEADARTFFQRNYLNGGGS